MYKIAVYHDEWVNLISFFGLNGEGIRCLKSMPLPDSKIYPYTVTIG